MCSYVLSNSAEQDIDEVINYLAKENQKAAYDFVDEFYAAFDKLTKNPEMGHVREDLTDYPVKFWPFKWYCLIIYFPSVPLEIVRVLSGYRDIYNLL